MATATRAEQLSARDRASWTNRRLAFSLTHLGLHKNDSQCESYPQRLGSECGEALCFEGIFKARFSRVTIFGLLTFHPHLQHKY